MLRLHDVNVICVLYDGSYVCTRACVYVRVCLCVYTVNTSLCVCVCVCVCI